MTLLHCFVCNNLDEKLIQLHHEACRLAGIDVDYQVFKVEQIANLGLSPHQAHGWFMEQVLEASSEEVVGFIDIDCILSSKTWLDEWKEKVRQSRAMIGLAQSACHLPSWQEVYAAPSFCLVHQDAWTVAGKPSLIANSEYDTAQLLSHCLAEKGCRPEVIMPTSHSDRGEVWKLGGKESYGIGTTYDHGKAFHLFQSGKSVLHIDLLEDKVEQLRSGASLFTN